ncbi:MAG: flagellar biosynthetic protein FliR [Pseudomonadota bacterium]
MTSESLSLVSLGSVRIGVLLSYLPIFTITRVPVLIRILLAVALSVALLHATAGGQLTTLADFVAALCREIFVGAVLVFGFMCGFGALLFGGRIADFQMGFGVAGLLDPASGNQSPLLGTLLHMAGLLTFFAVDGHLLFLRGLAFSFSHVPVGAGLPMLSLDALIAQFGVMFFIGLAVVAPVVMSLLMVDLGMAIAGRTMPQVNMFIVGLPLKIFLGLFVLAISIPYLSPLLQRLYATIFEFWEYVMT